VNENVHTGFAIARTLISRSKKGRPQRRILWVARTPKGSWKSSLTLQAYAKEGPSESGLPKGQLALEWYQSWKFLLSYFRQEEVEQKKAP
jgi:hypothetical protein